MYKHFSFIQAILALPVKKYIYGLCHNESLAEDITYISFSSPYTLRDISWGFEQENEETVMVIRGYKTTFLHNKSDTLTSCMTTLEFRLIDKIVYRDKDGSELTLWSKPLE